MCLENISQVSGISPCNSTTFSGHLFGPGVAYHLYDISNISTSTLGRVSCDKYHVGNAVVYHIDTDHV